MQTIPALILLIPLSAGFSSAQDTKPPPYLRIPVIDLDNETFRQVVVDKEEGQYLGHVTTVVLEDGKTILAVYPKGHGKGEIVDLRFATRDGQAKYAEDRKTENQILFTLYKTFSYDGELTWTTPEPILSRRDMNLCEPGLVRSPDGRQLAVLLRENARALYFRHQVQNG